MRLNNLLLASSSRNPAKLCLQPNVFCMLHICCVQLKYPFFSYFQGTQVNSSVALLTALFRSVCLTFNFLLPLRASKVLLLLSMSHSCLTHFKPHTYGFIPFFLILKLIIQEVLKCCLKRTPLFLSQHFGCIFDHYVDL